MATDHSPTAEELTAVFEKGADDIAQAASGLASRLMTQRPDPDQWAAREVLAHLADNAIVAAWRIRLVLAQEGPVLASYDQDAWAWPYRDSSPDDSLATLRLLRSTTAALLRRLPPEGWHRTGDHEERGAVTLRDLVLAQVSHVEEHLAQIKEIIRKLESQ